MAPASLKTLAYLAQVEPWNYREMLPVEVPICPCCRKPIEKGASRVKVHKDTLHRACYMYDGS